MKPGDFFKDREWDLYMSDGIHLLEAGNEIVTERLLEFLDEEGLLEAF